jgi:osmoprotectant transport system substrate-binding protein
MRCRRWARSVATALAASLVTLAGCSASSSSSSRSQKVVRISNKDFTEQRILSAMFQVTLEAQGFEVENAATPNLSTPDVRNALVVGDIDMYPEYTGTALKTFVTPPVSDAAILGDPIVSWQTASANDTANHIVWGQPTAYSNTWAYALRGAFAQANGVETLSDLVAYATANPTRIVFLSSNEFYLRQNDGVRAMLAAYGAGESLGACGTGSAPATGPRCAVHVPFPDSKLATVYQFFSEHVNDPLPGNPEYAVMVFSTDAQVAAYGLSVLRDDEHFWPFYSCAVTVREDFDQKYPDARAAISAFMPLLDGATMPQLNEQVDFGGKTPDIVARAWLESKGLPKK